MQTHPQLSLFQLRGFKHNHLLDGLLAVLFLLGCGGRLVGQTPEGNTADPDLERLRGVIASDAGASTKRAAWEEYHRQQLDKARQKMQEEPAAPDPTEAIQSAWMRRLVASPSALDQERLALAQRLKALRAEIKDLPEEERTQRLRVLLEANRKELQAKYALRERPTPTPATSLESTVRPSVAEAIAVMKEALRSGNAEQQKTARLQVEAAVKATRKSKGERPASVPSP